MRTFALERAQPNIFDWRAEWKRGDFNMPYTWPDVNSGLVATVAVRRELSSHTIWFGAFFQEANMRAHVSYTLRFLKDLVELGKIEFENGFIQAGWPGGNAPAQVRTFYRNDSPVTAMKSDGGALLPTMYLTVPEVTNELVASIVPWRFNILCTEIELKVTRFDALEDAGTAYLHYGLTVLSQAELF